MAGFLGIARKRSVFYRKRKFLENAEHIYILQVFIKIFLKRNLAHVRMSRQIWSPLKAVPSPRTNDLEIDCPPGLNELIPRTQNFNTCRPPPETIGPLFSARVRIVFTLCDLRNQHSTDVTETGSNERRKRSSIGRDGSGSTRTDTH